MKNIINNLFSIAILLFFVGCASEIKDWEEAKSLNTIPAFEKFIKDYGESVKIDSVYYYVQKISLDSIIAISTIEAYEAFRTQYPKGHFDTMALNLINDLIPEAPQIIRINIKSTDGPSCKAPFDMEVLHKIGSISEDKHPSINTLMQCGKDNYGLLFLGPSSIIQMQPHRSKLFLDYSYYRYARCQGSCVLKVLIEDKAGNKSNEFLVAVTFEK